MTSIDFKNIKSWAGFLLVIMIFIMMFLHLYFGENTLQTSVLLSLLDAGAKAGFVGGLADWFAVTALFRHPCGIALPHTAILPRKKKKLGEAFGSFIANYLLKDEDIERLFHRFESAKFLIKYAKKDENRDALLKILRRIAPQILEGIYDGRVRNAMTRALPIILNGKEANFLVIKGLKAMMQSDVHQEVFSFFLAQVKAMIAAQEPELRKFVEMRVREQGGRLVGWAIGGSVAHQVLNALKIELERVDPMDSRLRQGFTTWINEKITHLEERPEELSRLSKKLVDFLSDESLCEWSSELWQRVCAYIEKDSEQEDGWFAQIFTALLAYLLRIFEENLEWHQKLHSILWGQLQKTLPFIRHEITFFIPHIIDKWDGKELAERVEKGLGRDLAFIRINGTVVGFVIGLFLEMLFILLRMI